MFSSAKAVSVSQTSIPVTYPQMYISHLKADNTTPGLDVNTNTCCANSKFCVVGTDNKAACCALGSDCGIPCAVSEYRCQVTKTVNGTASASATCCARACSASSFKCAATLGGGCCPYNYACGQGKCSSTVMPTVTNNPVASQVPSGCRTSQFSCASSIGGGCCGIGSACTVVDNTNYCAAGGASAVRTGPGGVLASGTAESAKHSGLSTGAKAGIGGGIAGLALLIAGGVLYFCVLQRRAASKREEEESVPAMSQTSGSKIDGSKKTGSVGTRPSLPPARRQTADYFGPTAMAGPYTDASPGTSPGYSYRGVPINPQSPGDIAVPVEIDSRQHSNVNTPGIFEASKKKKMTTEVTELP